MAECLRVMGHPLRLRLVDLLLTGEYTVNELATLCVTPPYGSAKDPANYAGFVAANVLKGDLKQIQAEQLATEKEPFLLDVRTSEEFLTGSLAGARNIPLDELRGRLNELPENRKIVVFCKVGLRGYIGCRLLSQRGYDCRNLAGGLLNYQDTCDLAADQQAPPRPRRQPGSYRG